MATSKKRKKKTKKVKRKKKLKYSPDLSGYRKPSILPPEGFELLEPSEDDLGQAKKKISRLLNRICETITVGCWVKVKDYPKAAEVDGWLVVTKVRGVDTEAIVSMIQEAMLPDVPPTHEDYGMSVLGKGYWISVGFHWQGTGDEEERDQYKKWHGMIEVSSNYRSLSYDKSVSIGRSKILSSFAVGKLPSSRTPNSMISNIEKKFHRSIADIFVKIVWNKRNYQPVRSKPETED